MSFQRLAIVSTGNHSLYIFRCGLEKLKCPYSKLVWLTGVSESFTYYWTWISFHLYNFFFGVLFFVSSQLKLRFTDQLCLTTFNLSIRPNHLSLLCSLILIFKNLFCLVPIAFLFYNCLRLLFPVSIVFNTVNTGQCPKMYLDVVFWREAA